MAWRHCVPPICLFEVIGDKNTERGSRVNEWYDVAVPILDEAGRRLEHASG